MRPHLPRDPPFQAPDFYRRLGFAAVAEVIGKPIGHKEIVMRLVLD